MENKTILIKISGEALGSCNEIIDAKKVAQLASALCSVSKNGARLGIVVGGGNIFRGRSANDTNPTDADHMGMLATTINALALKNALVNIGCKSSVVSAIDMPQICDTYTHRHTMQKLDDGEIVVFSGGTGCPNFSTDTAAALRAIQIGADTLYAAKNIDGVYDTDPNKDPSATKFDVLTFDEVLSKGLEALDLAAIVLCKNHNIPITVFKLSAENLINAQSGNIICTKII